MARAFLLFVIVLGSCAPQARDISLSSVDLSDMQAVQAIQKQLGPRDGAAFADFVVRHHVKSASYCGDPLVRADGEAPETVGEAIDLSTRREALERQASLETKGPKHPRELAREAWDGLIRDRDILVDARARLSSEYGSVAERRPEWTAVEKRMAEIDKKLLAMKPTVFSSGT